MAMVKRYVANFSDDWSETWDGLGDETWQYHYATSLEDAESWLEDKINNAVEPNKCHGFIETKYLHSAGCTFHNSCIQDFHALEDDRRVSKAARRAAEPERAG